LGVGADLDPGVVVPNGPGRHVTACVQFTGGWEGSVILECPENLGIEAASLMFAMDLADTTVSEMKDALGELANMIGGNIKPMLPGPCQISMPTVVDGVEFEVSLPGARRVQRVGLVSQGKGFAVAVYDKQEATQSRS
jgi:chemotaxis protein CheX